jgi:hypothetical protein
MFMQRVVRDLEDEIIMVANFGLSTSVKVNIINYFSIKTRILKAGSVCK